MQGDSSKHYKSERQNNNKNEDDIYNCYLIPILENTVNLTDS